MTAAEMVVVVKATGITQTASQIRGLNTDLTKASGVAKTAGTDLTTTGTRGSKAMSGLKSAVGGLAAVGGFAVLTRGVKSSIEAFEESRKVAAQTASVIKSTGGAANVSAKQVDALAASISKKAGIDDEAIQSGENLLLTFKNVSNQVGAGNDIFNQATQTMTDMSVALGQDMKSSAIQLGKALNDPITGITALQRVGVTFTEQQKEQIKTLVESGDTLKAQKIILAELNSEFGGSAAAQATPIDKLKVAVGNLAESVGSVLVPAIDIAATVLNDVFGFFQEHEEAAIALGVGLGTLAAAFLAVKVHAGIAAIMATATAAIGAVGGASGLAAIGVGALDAALAVLTSPITAVIAAVGAIIAVLVHLYNTNEDVRKFIDEAWIAIKGTVEDVVGWIAKNVPPVFNTIKNVVVAVWNFILKHIVGTLIDIGEAVIGTIGDVVEWLDGAWHTIRDAATDVWTFIDHHIGGTLDDIWNAITGTIGDVIKWLDQAWKDIVKGVGDAFRSVGKTIDKIWSGIVSAVESFVNAIIDAINWVIEATGGDPIAKLGEGGGKGGSTTKGGGKGGAGGGGGAFARGGAFGRTGGFVGNPITLMGEEAPRFPEWVIPTNPAYRGRAQKLLMQAAQSIGFAAGGVFRGKTSVFGPPVEAAGTTASGVSSSQAGIALYNQSTLGKVFDVVIGKHKATLKQTDIGPAPWTGRVIDVTGAGAKAMGINPFQFPTDALGTASLTGGKAVKGAMGAVGAMAGGIDPKKALGKLPSAGQLPAFLQSAGESMLASASKYIKDAAASAGSAVGKGFKGDVGSGSASWGAVDALAKSFGLAMTSGTRGPRFPGDQSLHISGRARDYSGASGGMMNFFNAMVKKFGTGLNELFYDPAGYSIDNHQRVDWTPGGHSDHVHAAFQQGGKYGGGPIVQIDHMDMHTEADLTKFGRELGFRIARHA